MAAAGTSVPSTVRVISVVVVVAAMVGVAPAECGWTFACTSNISSQFFAFATIFGTLSPWASPSTPSRTRTSPPPGCWSRPWPGSRAACERQLEAHQLSGQWFDVLIRLYRHARAPPAHEQPRRPDHASRPAASPAPSTGSRPPGSSSARPCPSDRRGSFAVLTPAGEARIRAALPEHVDELARAARRRVLPRRARRRSTGCSAACATP